MPGRAARADNSGAACPGETARLTYQRSILPAISWDTWRALLGRDWTPAERSQAGWFNADAMIKAATTPDAKPLDARPPVTGDADERVLETPANADEGRQYDEAALLFHGGQWQQAIAAFDTIASTRSYYAAEAAYSAARAALMEGNVADGIHRIAALLADPAKHEIFQAAHHLVGTLASMSGDSPLLAARLVEISHLLMAPMSLRCSDMELKSLMDEADDDLQFLLRFTYEASFADPPSWSLQRRAVFARVAAMDPVIDLVRAFAMPTPFSSDGAWIEPFYPSQVRAPGFSMKEQPFVASLAADGAALTAHAREQARLTGSPLWAYALAVRTTNAGDIPAIRAGRLRLEEDTKPDVSEASLDAWLRAQEVRILLMSGRMEDALDTLQHSAPAFEGIFFADRSVQDYVVNGGSRFLLARRDLNGARRWAEASDRHWSISPNLQTFFYPALARDWTEALAPDRSSLNGLPETLPSSAASGLDLLPADRLVALARTPGVAPKWRRPLLSAAWIRYYMLGRTSDFLALFPDIRANFPELVADIDDINRAWMPWTRRHRITRMLLRLPGLSPRVLWARGVSDGYSRFPGPPKDLFAIDGNDPSDGNWWCPIDPARSNRDAFAQIFAGQLSSDFNADFSNIDSLFATGELPDGARKLDQIVHDWLAWHPLFKDADPTELASLAKAPSGPARLVGDAIAWANGTNWFTHWLGMDRDLPETLALAVRATRYGCRRAGPLGPLSRGAWHALHDRYPNSEWAERTPFWFDETAR
jgi:hypothetical protein